VHEMLYNKDTIGTISVKKYLEELIESLQELVSSHSKPIKFDLQIEDKIVDINKSIALGMITSELVSNSIKYAFINTQYPLITITLKNIKNQDTSNMQFCLKDNGIGFTDIHKKTTSLGMRLISIFSRELEGDFNFENLNGLKYTLTFQI
jgi:two-component system, sensor histidine kinase PdtaS